MSLQRIYFFKVLEMEINANYVRGQRICLPIRRGFIIFNLKDGEEKSRTHAQRKITLLFPIVLAH